MSMTDIPQYMAFGEHLGQGNLPKAMDNLDACIDIITAKQDKAALARLYQFKGNLHYQMGKTGAALACYQQSYDYCPETPLILLGYARFLATIGDITQTKALLSVLETQLKQWRRHTENEHSLGAYYDKIEDIKHMFTGHQGGVHV